MRQFKAFIMAAACFCLVAVAHAQDATDVKIVSPTDGQPVRGQITVQYEGLPTGGYALVTLNGNFVEATSQSSFKLDTLSDRTLFPTGDGKYQLDLSVLNASGRQVGTATTTLNVSNTVAETEGNGVRLVVFTPLEALSDNVARYRVFAESDANILGGESAGGGAGGGGSGGDSSDSSVQYIPTPLDWQLSALMRRIVRDTDLVDGAANLRTIVQNAFERQRLQTPVAATTSTGHKLHGKKKSISVPVKGPWNTQWQVAAETGQYFVKLVQANGTEINATRKAATIAIADLLPTFPDTEVRPGSTWETTMTILGELSKRAPINVKAPITFTSYENLVTPNGVTVRCAKLESRFRLPEQLAKTIAAGLESNSGRTAGTSDSAQAGTSPVGGSATAGGGTGSASDTYTADDIDIAQTDVSRVLWFDVVGQRVLRSEDKLRTYYEILSDNMDTGGGGGGAATAGESHKVNYTLGVTTWLDDRIPPPTESYNGGAGTPHAKENVTEPNLDKVTGEHH